MACIAIRDRDAMRRLGRYLAGKIASGELKKVLMSGEMGCGKTFLTTAIISFLPNSENCEVSSPSFNLCNLYPATPEIAHYDLYRCKNNIPDDLLDDILNPDLFAIVEWAEWLEEKPEEFLDINFKIRQNIRLLDLKYIGKNWEKFNDLQSYGINT